MRAEVSIIFILPRSYNIVVVDVVDRCCSKKEKKKIFTIINNIISLSLFKYGTRMAFHILLYFGTDLFPTQTNNYNFV